MPMAGFQWDDASERLLLLTIIHLAAPQLPKWDEVAEVFGQGVTGNAIRQKYQKLRNEAKEQFGGGAGSPAKNTPRKNAKTGKDGEATPGSATGKRKAGKKARDEAEGNEDDDEEEDGVGQSVKKVKTEENLT